MVCCEVAGAGSAKPISSNFATRVIDNLIRGEIRLALGESRESSPPRPAPHEEPHRASPRNVRSAPSVAGEALFRRIPDGGLSTIVLARTN